MAWNDGMAMSNGNIGTTTIKSVDNIAISNNMENQEIAMFIAAPDKYLSSSEAEAIPGGSILPTCFIIPQAIANIVESRKQRIKEYRPTAKSLAYSNQSIRLPLLSVTAGGYIPDKQYIMQHLSGDWRTGVNATVYREYSQIKVIPGMAISRNAINNKLPDSYLMTASAGVYQYVEKNIFVEANAFVEDWRVQNKAGSLIIEPISAIVEDYKPPSWGNTGSGSGVKNFKLTVQKYSFAEILLNFTDCKVIDALGLPDGMFFEKSYIKGSPKLSGKYPIQLKLDNTRVLDGFLIVPETPRQL